MNRSSLNWLAAGLIVLVLLAVIGQRRDAPSPSPTETDATFLPGLMDTLDDVNRITVSSGGNETVATLDRGDSGWIVSERDGYRADLTKVRHMLLSFAEANILEAKTANPELYSMLGVEDLDAPEAAGLSVTLQGAGEPTTIIVGNAAGEYRRYVRRAGAAQSYLINRDPEVGESASDWLDTTLIDLPSSRVRSVSVLHLDGSQVDVSKSDPEQANFDVANIPDDRELLYASVANVMGSVLQSLALEVVERADGESAEEIITSFETFDGLRITVRSLERDEVPWIRISAEALAEEAGAATGDGEPTSPVDEATELNARLAGWRFRIPAYKFDQLTRSMNDLLKAET